MKYLQNKTMKFRSTATKLAVGVTATVVSASSFAAAEDDIVTALVAKVTSVEGAAITLMTTVLVASIGIKLIKRFANKAS